MSIAIKKKQTITKKQIIAQPKQKEQQFIVITIDGPAGAGKGTLGRRLSKELDFNFLDTGSLYRAVAFAMVNMNGDIKNESDIKFALKITKKHLTPELLLQPELRAEEVGSMASKIAVIPLVRKALLEEQRNFASPSEGNGVILDGRDIGTVVCPNADIKLFVTANPEVRAKRRVEDLQKMGKSANYEQILTDMKIRDERDETREIAPNKPAKNAIIIDTSNLDIDESFMQTLDMIRNHMVSKTKTL